MQLKEQIEKLIQTLGQNLHEREEVVAVSLLGALSGQNTFLYGPPGTAKSLISRRISCAFQDSQYFEYLMNRFSTPEEVFGPVSLKALKADKYTRKTNGYLPTADFAFLDEIWKSSPAVLNTLLTLTNERIFRNGDETQQAPLKALFAASNETPAKGQGLDALYDRFTLRMLVRPMQSREKFESLINGDPVSAEVEVPEELKIDNATWKQLIQGIHGTKLSKETLTIISLIRTALSEMEEPVYVSDRRWQKASIVIKAAAMLCGRKQTNHSDALLLRHCLWTEESNRDAVVGIVEDAVRESGFSTDLNMAQLDKEKEKLDQEIHRELFHSDDVYSTKTLGGNDFFHVKADVDNYNHYEENIEFYIPTEKMKSTDDFHPVDRHGNEIKKLTCTFDAQGSCSTVYKYDHWNTTDLDNYVPEVLFHKGDKKNDINDRLISSLKDAGYEIKKSLTAALNKVQKSKKTHEKALHTPFVPQSVQAVAIEGISKQIDDLKLRITDCDRLIVLCG